MKESYDKSFELKCITCGDSNFETNANKTWLKCNRCDREYPKGYDELVELNQGSINREMEDSKNEIKADIEKDLKNMFKKAFKGNGNIKLR